LDYFLPNKVHFNDLIDLDYAASQQSFWSAQAKSLTPTCIVIPTTSQDVSDAVKILNIAYQASIPGCKFAIRGAGYDGRYLFYLQRCIDIPSGIRLKPEWQTLTTVSLSICRA
jgi:hypothetical protein